MITAEVKLWGALKDVSGERRATIALPQEFGLHDLVDALARKLGEQIRPKLMNRSGYVQDYVKVFVGDQETRGTPSERFGPFPAGATQIDIYIIPMSEGG